VSSGVKAGSDGRLAVQEADRTPQSQFQLRSQLNLTRGLEWDAAVYHVGALRGETPIPAYTRVDTRLGWRLGEYMDFSIVGQNLLRPRRPEFPDNDGLSHVLVSRSIAARITWSF